MANLNTWQRIDRVLPGKPWGNGANGAGTISGSISGGVNWHSACSGTAGNTTLTVSNGWSWNGLALVHQTQGTGAGQWEIVYINSISGATATLNKTLQYSYGTGAQCVLFQQFTTATVNASNVLAWNGSSGGIAVICAKDSITVSGAINGAGTGFRGGASVGLNGDRRYGQRGEGISGGLTSGTSALANAAGGGDGVNGGDYASGGGGGGNGTSGANGAAEAWHPSTGIGGGVVGSADLVTIDLGGGGGSNGTGPRTTSSVVGGTGGGIIILIGKTITFNSTLSLNGANGTTSAGEYWSTSGSGSGGSGLFIADTISFGTGKVTANGGTSPTAWNSLTGGNGGTGRIAAHYSSSISGTTSPTYTGIQDTSLKEAGATGNFIPFFM